jgi:acetate kinase
MKEPSETKSEALSVLTVNGGSSSIKFALFLMTDTPKRVLAGRLEGIGLPKGTFAAQDHGEDEEFSRSLSFPDHTAAVDVLMDWVGARIKGKGLAAIGHRVVHGGPRYWQPERITPEMIDELSRLSQFDPEHLPEEILLTRAFEKRFPNLSQVACFDTAFHHDMPRVAQILPIPRKYEARGVRRYGFHGLSCTYLIEELGRVAGAEPAQGRVILAHLGNGASITAVRGGKSIDTSMSFTPTAGIPMSTRSGDLDPGLSWYLEQTEHVTPRQFHHFINHESGLLGVSGISSDMRELLSRESTEPAAADAVALFCYQAVKWICALAGALRGLDILVFSGGIGENSPEIRARICRELDWLGLQFDEERNKANEALISQDGSPVMARMIRTDEESVIAKTVWQVLSRAN